MAAVRHVVGMGLLTRAGCISCLASLLLLPACGRQQAAHVPGTNAQPWVARVDGEVISPGEVAFEIKRREESHRPVGTPEQLVQELVERKVMLREASRSGVLEDPVVRREIENKQLGQWLDKTLQLQRDAVRVTDEELQAHYDAHPDFGARPAMERFAYLYRKSGAAGDGTERADLEKARAAYLADPAAATQQGRLTGFGTIAAQHSEDALGRYRGGDVGWLSGQESSSRLPADVLAAARALPTGVVSEVMASGSGLYVVMKTASREAARTPFADAAPVLRRQLIRLKQEEVERGFMSNLLARAKVELNREQVAKIDVPAPAKPTPPDLRSPSPRMPIPVTSP